MKNEIMIFKIIVIILDLLKPRNCSLRLWVPMLRMKAYNTS